MPQLAEEIKSWSFLEENGVLAETVQKGIEKHRKSNVTIHVTDPHGNPLPGVHLSIVQTNSAFHFGGNIFMLDGYPTADLNKRYEDAFSNLFNGATVPFYWRDLEPEPGKLRFTVDSPFIARRPPPDRVIAFCEERGLRMHGHTLVWDHVWGMPDWVSDDPSLSLPLWEKRVREIGERYGKRIHRWDVVNEVVPDRGMPVSRPMPANYARLAFKWAEQYFPAGTQFDINDIANAWDELLPKYTALIQRLIRDGARVGGIGLQFHLFGEENITEFLEKKIFRPEKLLSTLDSLLPLGLPVHVSEITLPAPRNDKVGRAQQAAIARDLYQLWFSHPAIQAITWWNVPDGGATVTESKIASVVIDSNLNPKPAYEALHELIRNKWRTHLSGVTDGNGDFAFRGFHGEYKIKVEGLTAATFTLRQSNDIQEQIVRVK